MLKKIFQAVRSFLFFILLTIYTIIYSFICLLSRLLPLKYRYSIVVSWLRLTLWLLKYLCGVNYEIHGLENVSQHNNGIILCKHQSAWETFLIPTIFYQPAIIIKKELLWVPFFGWGLGGLKPIAINRSDRSSSLNQILTQGKSFLQKGRWILVFPEGTRTLPGTVGHYKLGGARLAAETGYPVIPIAHNAGRYWPKGKFLIKPGTIQVYIGPLMESKNRSPENILEEAKNWIEGTIVKEGL